MFYGVAEAIKATLRKKDREVKREKLTMDSEIVKSLDVFEEALNKGFNEYGSSANHKNMMNMIALLDLAVETIAVLHDHAKKQDAKERELTRRLAEREDCWG
tara:strand:- start:1062 stop:1367 length:306 start_codon:yes stop_codon:yes gene_type:complete